MFSQLFAPADVRGWLYPLSARETRKHASSSNSEYPIVDGSRGFDNDQLHPAKTPNCAVIGSVVLTKTVQFPGAG